jgi:hypothetical protein
LPAGFDVKHRGAFAIRPRPAPEGRAWEERLIRTLPRIRPVALVRGVDLREVRKIVADLPRQRLIQPSAGSPLKTPCIRRWL